MDYDGSDTQGHNLQLTGDGKSKSSSVPRPYAFPRFDFEDNLQGHLRFDSLVESEAFLDIQSQEDNQWIEDFSRGSSAIEFSSSATECCSITRQHNVWSEATSLESVELLLKSVGQEQIVSKDTVSENSNTFNEFGDLTENMEPKFEHDNVDSGYTGISDASRSQDELLNNISALDNNVEGKFSQVEEITLSQVHLVQNLESSSQMCVDTLEEECRAPVTVGDLLLGTESNDRSEQGVQSTVYESMNVTEYGSSHTAVPDPDINSNTRSLESSILPDQVSSHDHEGTDSLIRVVVDDNKPQISSQEMPDADTRIIEHHMVTHAMRSDDVPRSFSLSDECADKGTGAEVIINSNDSTVMSCTQESQFQLLQGVDKDDSLTPTTMQGEGEGEAGGLSASKLMTAALTGNDKLVDCSTPTTMLQGVDKGDSLTTMTMLGEGEVGGLSASRVMTAALTGNDELADNSELHITKLNTESHPNAENNFGSEPNLDSVNQLDQKLCNDIVDNVIETSHEEGGPGDVSGSLSPSSLIKREGGDSIVKIKNVDVAESLGFPVSSSSVELTKEIGGAPCIKDLRDASTVIVDGSSFSEGSKKDFEDETEFQLSNVHESGEFSLDAMKEETISLCTEVIDKSSETCVVLTSEQRTSTIMESPSHDEPIINQPQPDVVGNTLPETNSILCKKNNDHVEKENNEDMRGQSFGTESSREDEKEDSGGRRSPGTSLATLNRSDQMAPEVGNSYEAKSEMPDDSTASQLSETEGKLIPDTETRRSNQVATEINSSCEDKSDMLHDSTASPPLPDTEGRLIPVMETCSTPSGRKSQIEKLVDCSKGLEVVSGCDSTVLNKGNVMEEFLSAPDPQRAACTSPTIITSTVQIPDESKQEGVGGSELASRPSTSEDIKVKDTSGDDNSFTFKVNSLLDVEKEKADNWTPFPIAAIQKSSVVLEGVTTPDVYKIHTRLPQETSGDSPGDHSQGITKTSSGRRKRASGKGSAKENSQTGFNGNDTTPDKPSRKRGTFSSVSLSPCSSQPGQFVGLQPHTERKRKKLSTTSAIPTSDLPDLNSSALKSHASPPTSFLQPFTDMQQVQLRAQIFVYGSLIQGTAPDEACMVSAFGSSDRERVVWEPLWQAAVERGRNKKPQSTSESPMNSHSTGKVPEVAGKQCSPQTMVFQSPASRAGNKANPTAILSPITQMSSPLWSISTPYHDMSQFNSQQRRPVSDYQPAVSPLHTYQIPPVRNIVGHTTWLSQTPCSPSPWASQTTALSVHAPFTTTPASEKIKPSPVKNLSLPAPSSAVKDSPSTPLFPTGGPSTLPPGSSQMPEQNKGTLPSERPSADPKPRRRKKSQASSDIPQSIMLSQSRSEPIVASSLPTPLAPVTTPTCHVTTSMVDVSPACSIPQLQVGCLDAGIGSSCSEETLGKVADAMLQAEKAAVFATTALSHCQALWSQLAKQAPGTAQEAEAKIAASAGAAAAAACVAKAAAAAAKVASNAALQAKLMADEVLVPSRVPGGAQSGNLVFNVQSVGSATPASILTGDGGGSSQPGSILLAAREAAKRRIEAASAAAKQAENLDAIVRAAELAAAAVSQAGQIVTMGEPLPLKELVNAGPEGFWNLSQGLFKLVRKSGNGSKKQINVGGAEGAMASSKLKSGGPSGKGSQVTDQGKTLPGELSNSSFDEKARSAHGISEPVGVCEEFLGIGNDREVSDMVQGDSSGAVNVQDEELGVVQGNIIKEGCIIEVYKDNDGLKPAWFSANVLTLQDGKAFVHYTSLLSKEGRENLKEWVTLESEGGKAPRIRPILPITGSYCQGTKKRRRSAMGTYTWNVGDRVDVSIQDSWREGIVTEKNEKDETTLTVHFPARGETSAVSVQQLRPSRIWTSGNWVEWSRLKGHDHSTEGDMPLEKRPRLHSPSKSAKGKNQSLVETDPVVGKLEESKLQTLSASDKVFNIGRSTKAETKPDVRRPLRTGLQKEKSRVVFGVPKPGKKQKFMEVSKHFPANQNRKGNEIKDPVKFTKYLMPQGAASHGRRNPPRVDIKEKQPPKVSTSKPRSSSNRTVPHKDNFVSSTKADHHEVPTLPGEHVEISEVQEENVLKTAALTGSSSASEGSLSSVSTNLDGTKKKSSLSAKTELLNKRKQVPFGGQLTKVDEEKAPDEVSEPRRSNRRFQPTHRLLEGLQSSMAIPKMSSIPHDKGQGQKSRFRTAPTKGK